MVQARRTSALGLGAWARLLIGHPDLLAELQLLKGTVPSSQGQLLLRRVQASRLFARISYPRRTRGILLKNVFLGHCCELASKDIHEAIH